MSATNSTFNQESFDVVAVLLAAGLARRMGHDKALLPWPTASGRATMVEACVELLTPFVDRIVVVCGACKDTVNDMVLDSASVAGNAASFAPIELVDGAPHADMFESIRRGLQRALNLTPRTVLLHPVDVPAVKPDTILAVMNAHRASGQAVMPEYRGKGGHPVAIPAELLPRIIAWSGDGGLRQFWLDHADRRLRLPLDDPAVIADLDTPEQYEAALNSREANRSA